MVASTICMHNLVNKVRFIGLLLDMKPFKSDACVLKRNWLTQGIGLNIYHEITEMSCTRDWHFKIICESYETA